METPDRREIFLKSIGFVRVVEGLKKLDIGRVLCFENPDLDGRRHRRSIRNDGWVHLRVFRCSETSLDGFEVNLLIGFSEIDILVRDILKENYETLVWNASRSRGKGGRLRRLQAVHGCIK